MNGSKYLTWTQNRVFDSRTGWLIFTNDQPKFVGNKNIKIVGMNFGVINGKIKFLYNRIIIIGNIKFHVDNMKVNISDELELVVGVNSKCTAMKCSSYHINFIK